MPVWRFKDLDAARRALWVPADRTDLAARIRSLWALSTRLTPRGIPRGVRKFRGMAEANAERERWTRERVERLRVLRARERQA